MLFALIEYQQIRDMNRRLERSLLTVATLFMVKSIQLLPFWGLWRQSLISTSKMGSLSMRVKCIPSSLANVIATGMFGWCSINYWK